MEEEERKGTQVREREGNDDQEGIRNLEEVETRA
jgi:hypothetical protein